MFLASFAVRADPQRHHSALLRRTVLFRHRSPPRRPGEPRCRHRCERRHDRGDAGLGAARHHQGGQALHLPEAQGLHLHSRTTRSSCGTSIPRITRVHWSWQVPLDGLNGQASVKPQRGGRGGRSAVPPSMPVAQGEHRMRVEAISTPHPSRRGYPIGHGLCMILFESRGASPFPL